MNVADTGEAALIDRLREVFGTSGSGLQTGIGDDGAVFHRFDGAAVATTDLLLEDVHFDRRFISPRQLGYKAVAVNVSDLYAMAARPRHLLIGLGLPDETPMTDVEALLQGFRLGAEAFDVTVAGGDTCRSRHGIVLAVTALGESSQPVTRAGARTGDHIYVTAPLGGAAAGLKILSDLATVVDPVNPDRIPLPGGLSDTLQSRLDVADLITRHVSPQPRPAAVDSPTAMLDLSDGLLIDLYRLLDASDAGADLFLERIPVCPALERLAAALGLDAETLALEGGEDYALLFTARPGTETGDAVRIGDIRETGRRIVRADGSVSPLEPRGYDHFAGRGTRN